jgi:hypothetical protein
VASLVNDRVPFGERPIAWRVAIVGGAAAAVLLGLLALWTLAQAGDRPLALGSASWLWTASLAAGALAVMTAAGQRLGLWGLRIFFVLAGLPMLLRGMREGEVWLLVGAGACAAWLFATAFARPTHARD